MSGRTYLKIKAADDAYIEKAKALSEEEIERLQFRMGGKLVRRTEDNKLALIEALAIQLETEDAALQEWREKRTKLLEKSSTDKKEKKDKAKK